MYRTASFIKLVTLAILFAIFAAVMARTELSAAQLTLSWTDNSNNEDGFRVERKTGTAGTYMPIISLGANAGSHVDTNLPDATTFCYRVNAYNSTGSSGYSNEGCATTASVTPSIYLLSVSKAGTGSGTVTATGINCGSDCSESVASGTQVALAATAASGSTFAGWTGTGCGSTVTVTGNMTCTATFNLSTFTLTVAKAGTGSGTVTATGINCGSDCSESVASGTPVALAATAASGSTFAGWTGTGCASTVTITGNMTCTATFNSLAVMDRIGIYRPSTGEWFLDQNGSGAWDNCQIDLCVESYGAAGSVPVVGEWDAFGVTQIGLFGAQSAQWFMDKNTNETWDGCTVDLCLGPFGVDGDLPVVGKWTSGGYDRVGVFHPSTGSWYLDRNNDGSFKKCRKDLCGYLSVYMTGDLPVVGDWKGDGVSQLGLFRPSTGEWFLDSDGNKSWNGCGSDRCVKSFGGAGDRPVTGDWNGLGISKIGVFRPSTGEWYLDFNGNGTWDGCGIDQCVASFGLAGDVPLAGKW
jgi:Divergent InlB B-repeat domain